MSIARLKITLDRVMPVVMRRVEVPLGIKLSDLHLVIQVAMPWWNHHLYEFRAAGIRWGLPDPDGSFDDDPLDARKATLFEVLDDTSMKALAYLYDFGDGWEHKIRIERIGEPEPGVAYPRLLEVKGRCPPEDVGGPWGYQKYLEAMADSQHERHAEMVQWRGPDFDPKVVDVTGIEKELAKLGRRWSRRSSRAPRKAS
jgi:Plasmid pRiA4b ORF-3-like protein